MGSGKPTARAGHQRALDQMEQGLSVEQIAHFRGFVASHNSKILLSSAEAHTKALDVVDAIVANLGELCLIQAYESQSCFHAGVDAIVNLGTLEVEQWHLEGHTSHCWHLVGCRCGQP